VPHTATTPSVARKAGAKAEAERKARMAEILRYNEEDLAATWAVFEWLKGKSAQA
jgi:predicted RecB family nuclease